MAAVSPRDEKDKENKQRVNRQIRAREVRVVDAEGGQLGVLRIDEALERAAMAGLDLVEVAPLANPPVCRIMDYGKFKYQQKKRAVDAKKNQTSIEVKEIKFRPKIEEHDFETKVRNIKKFLEDGNKAKITMMFRGRELSHTEIGKELLEQVMTALKDAATVEQAPKLEGRNMTMVLGPLSKSAATKKEVSAKQTAPKDKDI